jgi:hypothetical protein
VTFADGIATGSSVTPQIQWPLSRFLPYGLVLKQSGKSLLGLTNGRAKGLSQL